MGCDIHMYVERLTSKGWRRVSESKGIRHPYYSESMNEEAKKYFDKKTWSPGRNYSLFGLLAGVRSRIFTPFVQPRGIPEDVSPGVGAKWEIEADGSHTPSYMTLPELLAVQDNVETVPCHLNVSQFKEYTKTGKVPEGFYNYPPPGVRAVSNAEMTRVMNLAAFLDETQYFTAVDHKMSLKEISKAFWEDIIGAMKKVAKDPAKVRCVFWFDN